MADTNGTGDRTRRTPSECVPQSIAEGLRQTSDATKKFAEAMRLPKSQDGPHYSELLTLLWQYVATPHEKFVWGIYFDWSRPTDRDLPAIEAAAKLEQLPTVEYIARKTTTEIRRQLKLHGITPPNSVTEDPTDMEARVEQRALAVLVVHPDWTVKKIATQVGTSREYLSSKDCPKFKAARAAIRASSIPTGTKGKDGSLDATGDDDLDFDAMDSRMKPKR